ncbi:protease inhibitor I42 family protein [Chloroflexota bacterium]
MKKKLVQIFTCAIVAISLALVACSPGASWVLVSKVDSGKTISVHVNQELIVDLDSNQTTGFQWQVAEISDQTVLGKVNNVYNAPEAGAPVGAGGVERWTFKGIKKGTAQLCMGYNQPWQGGEKTAETFTLTIVVE